MTSWDKRGKCFVDTRKLSDSFLYHNEYCSVFDICCVYLVRHVLHLLSEKGENRDHADRCRGKNLQSKRFHVSQNFKILIEWQKHYSDLTVLTIIVKRCKGKKE